MTDFLLGNCDDCTNGVCTMNCSSAVRASGIEHIAASIWAGVFPSKASAEQVSEWRASLLAHKLEGTAMTEPSDNLVKELEAGKSELLSLMDAIWRGEYRKAAPNWKPLPDLTGMVTQIDNMYAGVREQRDKAQWDLAEARAQVEAMAGALDAAAENERLTTALEWYAEQVAGCRKLGSIGDPYRHALDADGGNRARQALSTQQKDSAMTTKNTDKTLPVEQVDRDAAADLYLAEQGSPNSPHDHAVADSIRAGNNDHWDAVQAFARHRIEHSTTPPAAHQGWIVANASKDRWRAWVDGMPVWVDDRTKATRYYFRSDANAVHAEDEDAWCIEAYATPPAEDEVRPCPVCKGSDPECQWGGVPANCSMWGKDYNRPEASEGEVERVAKEAVDRAIKRLQGLPSHAGRPTWDQIVAEEMHNAIAAMPGRGERAGIVAWLRTAEFNTNTNWGRWLANRIERGDHLAEGGEG